MTDEVLLALEAGAALPPLFEAGRAALRDAALSGTVDRVEVPAEAGLEGVLAAEAALDCALVLAVDSGVVDEEVLACGTGPGVTTGADVCGSTTVGLAVAVGWLSVAGGKTIGAATLGCDGAAVCPEVMLSVESRGGASWAKAEVEPSARTAESAVAAPSERLNIVFMQVITNKSRF